MRASIRAVLLLALTGLAVADNVQASIKRITNIPPQNLGAALQTFARDRDLQVLYRTDVVGSLQTKGAKGELTFDQALDQLLSGTGLTYRYLDDQTITILPVQTSGAAEATWDKGNSTAQGEANGGRRTSGKWWRIAQTTPREGASSETGAVGGSQGAQASESSGESQDKLQEIVVTAQKREQRAFDVPISIVALTADELEKRKIAGIDDLSLAVPGLMIASAGGWTRRIVLRGISNVFGASSLIGLYMDDASVTSGADLQLDLRTYDLERIEVLRGPQGTLYGEGSVGGTIRFITKDPALDRFAMTTDVAAMFTQDGAPGQRANAAVNVPLMQDKLGLRIAGTFDHQGGWIDQPAADQKNFNEQNVANVRVKGLWRPTEDFTVNAMAIVHRNNAAPNTGENDDGDYVQAFNQTTTPSVEDDYSLYNATLAYDFTGARLLSTSTYIDQDRGQKNYGYRLLTGPLPTPRADVLKPLYTRDAKILSEELRLTSTGAGPWQWTLGGFYRRSRIINNNTFYYALPGPAGSPLPALILAPNNSLSKSWAAFGDTSYRLTERVTLGAGLRYFKDDQEYTTAALQTGQFHSLNPRLYAQFKISENVNTYASAAKGFRSGGFNALNRPRYDAESVWTYELGTKAALLDGRLSTEAAVFYSNYQDYQITGLVGPFNITSNAGAARIQGVEWSIAWRPVEQWTLGFNGSYMNSEFYEIDAVGSTQSEGDSLDLFPKYGYTVSVQRDFRWNGKAGFARLDYDEHGAATYKHRHFLGALGAVTPWYYSESDVINMLNLNVSLQWNDNLSLGVFAQNLLNDRGYLDPFGIEETAARARPRTYGIQFGMAFD